MKRKLYNCLAEVFPPIVAEDIANQSGGDYYNLGLVNVEPRYKKKLDALLSLTSCVISKGSIKGSNDAYPLFASLGTEKTESFYIATLNNANQVISIHAISTGGVTSTSVDIKLILRHVIMDMATGIILCHNHPSGNRTPSTQDINLTSKIKQACHSMDVKVLDHIIIAKQNYYSFLDEGNLN
jgi:DNA repair protein RadC